MKYLTIWIWLVFAGTKALDGHLSLLELSICVDWSMAGFRLIYLFGRSASVVMYGADWRNLISALGQKEAQWVTLYDCASPYVNIRNNCPSKAYKCDAGCKTTIRIQVTLICFFCFPMFCDHISAKYSQYNKLDKLWPYALYFRSYKGHSWIDTVDMPKFNSTYSYRFCSFYNPSHLLLWYIKAITEVPVLPQTGWNHPQVITFYQCVHKKHNFQFPL